MAKALTSELLQCAICLNDLEDAKALPCLHSFCMTCLDRHIRTSQISSTKPFRMKRFPCPTCRALISCTRGGVKDFPNDFRVVKLRDALKSSYSSRKVYTCDVCSVDSDLAEPAAFYCVECEKYFCLTCNSRHEAKPVLSSHIVITISENSTEDEINCSEHKHEPIKFHCKSCDQHICVMCVMGKHEHHEVINQEASIAIKRTKLRSCMHHLGNQIWQLHDIMFNLTCMEGHIKGHYEETKLSIKKNSNRAATKVYQEESKLIDEMDNIYQKQSEEVYQKKEQCRTYIQHFKSLQSRLEAMLRFQDLNKTLQSHQEILSDIQNIEITSEYKNNLLSLADSATFVPDTVVSVGQIKTPNEDHETNYKSYHAYLPFKLCTDTTTEDLLVKKRNSGEHTEYSTVKPTEKPLFGKLQHSVDALKRKPVFQRSSNSIIPRLITQIGGHGNQRGQISLPYGILFTKNDQLIVGENGNCRLQVFDKEGISRKIIQLQNSTPRCITETKDGDIVITDENEKCLKVVDLCTEKLTKLPNDPSIPFPFGIITLDNGKLVVSDMIYENVSIISPSGIKEQQFGSYGDQGGTFDNPSYLATDLEGNIFVSDSGHHEIKVFDKTGKYLFRFGEYGSNNGQMKYPKGIAVDTEGLIIVADAGNDRVVAYTRLGFYHSTVLDKTDGIDRPTGLAYSSSGLLAVSMPDKHEIYVYELSTAIPKA